MTVKAIPFNRVTECLLNTPEAIRGYKEADKQLALSEMLYETRERAVNEILLGDHESSDLEERKR